ncbi:MAG: inosine/xanthosine triphosphatase [Candidatus Diapherotrites archaeon]|nr:inosine/xanthosine triphosphatase [Candidatus Diapherotrites archaeon]
MKNNMKILIGSKNPVKANAVKDAFSNYFNDFEVLEIEVDSMVSAQPIDREIFEGAENRATELRKINREQNMGATYFVGIEGGITNYYSKWFAFGGICIMDENGKTGFGTSPLFELPKKTISKILEGNELGDVIDCLIKEKNSKQKTGAIGFFTKNVMTRKKSYTYGLVVALIPFINKNIYFDDS